MSGAGGRGELYERQMALLGEFLARGAITRGQYEKSAGVLKEKFAAGPGGSGEDKRLSKQLAFILEADRLKEITRQTWLADGSRKENDAEHSWHLALMAMLLCEYSGGADMLRVMKMVLVHDMVEIEAGDTYAYDYAGQSTAHEREAKAAKKLFGMLPEDQAAQLTGLWEEFEQRQSAEAKFAHSLDNFQPMLLNDASGGKGWHEHGVRLGDVMRRNASTAEGSEKLWEYMSALIERNVACGNLIDDRPHGGTPHDDKPHGGAPYTDKPLQGENG
jgi:putative hydrolase of HD superfamily